MSEQHLLLGLKIIERHLSVYCEFRIDHLARTRKRVHTKNESLVRFSGSVQRRARHQLTLGQITHTQIVYDVLSGRSLGLKGLPTVRE